MIASLLMSGTDSVSINKLFASQTTPINEILDRTDVATYLRQLTDSTKIPKNVLAFVERNMPKLLLAAQQKPLTTSANNSFASASHAAGKEDGATSTPVNSIATSGNGEKAHNGTRAVDKSATKARTNSTHTRPSAAAVAMGTEDAEDDDEALALGVHRRDDLALRSANATSLLYVYVSSPDCSNQAIEQLVPVSLAALAHPGALNPAVSLCVQRLLLAAFDNDFIKTTETIAATLDEDIVRGTIDNLSQSSVVAETLIALFGSALSASFMMAPTTKTELFTSAWIHYKFVDHFCAEMREAIGQRTRYNYFYFFREVLKRGFSHTAGPVADVLLRHEFFAPMLDTVITTCEDDARLPVPDKTSPNSSLSPEAMAVMALIVSLLRKSLILPETREMYATTTDYIAPLRSVREQKERLVALLQYGSTSGAALVSPNTLGLTRLSVCELFTELSLYQLSSTDSIWVESGFLPAFLQLCEAYAGHDSLARLLHKCVHDLFTRPVLLGETLSDAKDRDILVKHVIELEDNFQRAGAVGSPTAAGALFSSLFYFSSAESMRYAPMATFSIDLVTTLDTKPHFAKDLGGLLSPYLTPFREHAGIRERVAAMRDPITGDNFHAKGSAGTPAVRHHPVVNLVGDRLRNKLSFSSASDGETGSPTAAGAAADHSLPSATGVGKGTNGNRDKGDTSATGRDSCTSNKASGGDSSKSTTTPTAAVKELMRDMMQMDLESIMEEGRKLREEGSPQLQAYPSFRSMHLTFGSSSSTPGGEESEGAASSGAAKAAEEPVQDGLAVEVPCSVEAMHVPRAKEVVEAEDGAENSEDCSSTEPEAERGGVLPCNSADSPESELVDGTVASGS